MLTGSDVDSSVAVGGIGVGVAVGRFVGVSVGVGGTEVAVNGADVDVGETSVGVSDVSQPVIKNIAKINISIPNRLHIVFHAPNC
jgi:pantoate kinase